jgi:hypothetical protein
MTDQIRSGKEGYLNPNDFPSEPLIDLLTLQEIDLLVNQMLMRTSINQLLYASEVESDKTKPFEDVKSEFLSQLRDFLIAQGVDYNKVNTVLDFFHRKFNAEFNLKFNQNQPHDLEILLKGLQDVLGYVDFVYDIDNETLSPTPPTAESEKTRIILRQLECILFKSRTLLTAGKYPDFDILELLKVRANLIKANEESNKFLKWAVLTGASVLASAGFWLYDGTRPYTPIPIGSALISLAVTIKTNKDSEVKLTTTIKQGATRLKSGNK